MSLARALTHKIQAVSGALIVVHFRNTATNHLAVSGVTRRHMVNADVDACTRLPISQAGEPILECNCFANFDYFLIAIHGLLFCKLVLGCRK